MPFSYPALEHKSTPEDFSYNLKFLDEHGMKETVLSLDDIFPMHELSKNPIYYPETCHSLIICWFQNKELYFKALNKCTLRQLQAASTLVEMSSKLNITGPVPVLVVCIWQKSLKVSINKVGILQVQPNEQGQGS